MRCMLESPGAPTAHLCVDGWPSEVPGRGAVAPWRRGRAGELGWSI